MVPEDRMTAFCYGFGMALSIAMAIAIGYALARENGVVWTKQMLAAAAVVAIIFGLILGWAMDQWLTFVFAAPGHRVY